MAKLDNKKTEKVVLRSQGREVWRRLTKNKGAMLGLAIIIILTILALTVDLFIDFDTQIAAIDAKNRNVAPCAAFPFGTDNMGRNLLYRVVYGTKYSLFIGVMGTVFACVVGIFLGLMSGYYGGLVDDIIMRFIDIIQAIPAIMMGIVVVSALGASMTNLIIAIGIAGVPYLTRITRAAVLTVKNQEYIEAAKAVGLSEPAIMIKHILPNCVSPILVAATMQVAQVILAASSLSFLGLGVPVPSPEWGSLLSAGRSAITSHPYLCLFPGIAIVITVLAFNLFGDGFRDALDPKLRK
ncbi:MAG: ABC transporter permease [Eubacteriales bacterium]|nr:ABC transporter permease [Eubacteriales bacterium]